MRRQHRLLIGEPTAELVKKTIGSVHPSFDKQELEVRGRSLTTGAPASLIITGGEVREATNEVIAAIIGAIRQALENTPPELSGDIISAGIALAGGGALLKGLDKRIHEELDVLVTIADDPLTAVVQGAGKCLDNPELYRSVLY
jgi:rod shape-determining protein MreB